MNTNIHVIYKFVNPFSYRYIFMNKYIYVKYYSVIELCWLQVVFLFEIF